MDGCVDGDKSAEEELLCVVVESVALVFDCMHCRWWAECVDCGRRAVAMRLLHGHFEGRQWTQTSQRAS